MKKTLEDVAAIVKHIAFMDREFKLLRKGDGYLLQIQYMEVDVESGMLERQKARKWYISPWATETEIVETAFKAARVSNDHVLKEHFTYKGRRVYSPHFHINGRLGLCDHEAFDRRPQGE